MLARPHRLLRALRERRLCALLFSCLPLIIQHSSATSEKVADAAAVQPSFEEVEALRRRVQVLEAQMQTLSEQVKSMSAPSQSSSNPLLQHRDAEVGLPDYYKLKDIAPERRMINIWSWLYVSFEVYAGDRYVGEFRQSNPFSRLIWDDMLFYDAKGAYQGQLFFSFMKWFLGVVPNPFVGQRTLHLCLANGSMPLFGSQESLLKSLFSAERRSMDFVWSPTSSKFKSRKTVEVRGQQEWIVQEALGGGKVAEIKESVVHDMWGRMFRGWTVTLFPGTRDILDPSVPGYLAAFDLAEAEDNLPAILGTVLCVSSGVLGLAILR
eukprot:TRINITY_DN13240_c0_g1_i1.p1 TRINITY_DN13240_c0_g1~~TRINITY_DN13240_c0_g1_i1.p1  ORF type:complete len:323 (-),score=36.81 TRINITY_DN13240_c0_g1_i1:225-1193(-)